MTARLDAMRGIWRNLAPGGHAMLDFLTPRQATPARRSAGAVASRTISRSRSQLCLGIRVGDREERHCCTLIEPRELLDETRACGLRPIDALDYNNSGPPRPDSPALAWVLRKSNC